MGIRGIAVVACVLGACVSPQLVICGDTACPAGTACATVTYPSGAKVVCVDPDQLAACSGHADGDACMVGSLPGTCHGGACLANTCGDLLIDVGEACDDGNTVDGDGCSADCQSNEQCGNGVVDLLQGEACDDGNVLSHDGCASSCRAESQVWSTLVQEPPFRQLFVLVYDADRQRTILFGGASAVLGQYTAQNDLWEWDGAHWAELHVAVPGPRFSAAAAYDHARHQIVMFGGFDNNSAFDDTWLWDGHAWTRANPAHAPPKRFQAAMTYDAARQRIVLFGGFDMGELGDTWEWDGHDWTEQTGGGPPSRSGHGMAYDPERGMTVMFGGSVIDTWEYDGQWHARTPATLPPGRAQFAMGWDPDRRHVIIEGGIINLTDTWEWDGVNWVQGSDGPKVQTQSMATDLLRHRAVMLGNDLGFAPAGWKTFERIGGAWILAAAPGRPPARHNLAAATDINAREVIMYGGTGLADLWVWGGVWQQVITAGPSPGIRANAAMAYDAARGQTVLFGGAATGDTWMLDHHVWTSHTATPTDPLPRNGAAMTFDAARDVVVMFGGSTGGDETWTWNGTTWTHETPATSPPARSGASLVYDPIRRRSVLFGGASLSDTWEWDGVTWTNVTPVTGSPPFRVGGGMAWNAATRRVVLYGGYVGVVPRADIWEWDGVAWTQVIVADTITRAAHALVPAIDGSGVLAIDGSTIVNNVAVDVDSLARLSYESTAPTEICTSIDTDNDGKIGCADPDCWSRCDPECEPGETCTATRPRCGDGTCSAVEDCSLCPADCGACPSQCGDFVCDPVETAATCRADCS